MIKFIAIVLLFINIGLVKCEPQLDIPGVQHSTEAPKGLKVVVLPNSYANNEHENEDENQPKSEANTHFDSDRSQRYGSAIK